MLTEALPPPNETRRKVRVLVADDDERSLDSLVALLACDGFDIESFHGGHDALERLGLLPEPQRVPSPRIDFLVLDYNMPDVSGIEVLRHVCVGLGTPLPAILVSGESSRELERVWLATGGFALLPKPVIPDDFRSEVRRLVRNFFGEEFFG